MQIALTRLNNAFPQYVQKFPTFEVNKTIICSIEIQSVKKKEEIYSLRISHTAKPVENTDAKNSTLISMSKPKVFTSHATNRYQIYSPNTKTNAYKIKVKTSSMPVIMSSIMVITGQLMINFNNI